MKRKELSDLLATLDVKGAFAVNVRALDAIHVATAEVLASEGNGEPMEFWTHDERQAAAALARGLTVGGNDMGEP